MENVYARFSLEPSSIRTRDGSPKTGVPILTRTVVEALKEKGYSVFESSISCCGVPDMLVYGDLDNMLVDIRNVSNNAGLVFNSGEVYTEITSSAD